MNIGRQGYGTYENGIWELEYGIRDMENGYGKWDMTKARRIRSGSSTRGVKSKTRILKISLQDQMSCGGVNTVSGVAEKLF